MEFLAPMVFSLVHLLEQELLVLEKKLRELSAINRIISIDEFAHFRKRKVWHLVHFFCSSDVLDCIRKTWFINSRGYYYVEKFRWLLWG